MAYMKRLLLVICVALLALVFSSCDISIIEDVIDGDEVEDLSALEGELPEYAGMPYVDIAGGVPDFADDIDTGEPFEQYGELDSRGRCTMAIALVGEETMPLADEERGDISYIHPSGWRYDNDWERCHLIAWCLTAENDNERNLITGTHYLNTEGMLPFEVEVARYIEDTGNHVLYAVTPYYDGKNQIASGVQIQAYSVEDKGRGVCFNVYCFNVQPGYDIDYMTGEVTASSEESCDAVSASRDNYKRTYVVNTSSGKFHYPSCTGVAEMAEKNKKTVKTTRSKLIKKGYEPCGSCNP